VYRSTFRLCLVSANLTEQTDISQCSFLVDSYFPTRPATELEPHYVLDETWETLSCQSFLDSSQTGLLGRLIWIPNLPFIPEPFQRKWGRYCLLQRLAEANGV
jgi:alpha-1,2-mannosyltransferase